MEEVRKKITLTQWGSQILTSIVTSQMMVTKNPQNVHRKYFWAILTTFISEVKIDVNICEPHCVNLFFFWTSSIVQVFDYLTFGIFLTTWHLFDNLTSFWYFGSKSPIGPIAHIPVPHCPCITLPMWADTPCTPYPLCPYCPCAPYPQWAWLPMCPITPVPHLDLIGISNISNSSAHTGLFFWVFQVFLCSFQSSPHMGSISPHVIISFTSHRKIPKIVVQQPRFHH